MHYAIMKCSGFMQVAVAESWSMLFFRFVVSGSSATLLVFSYLAVQFLLWVGSTLL